MIALSVDHGLHPASAEWSAFALARAEALGAEPRLLSWRGLKPGAGLAAAARRARHGLLADAARQAGAIAIVTGHTASDARENALLGQGPLREWTPSPVWPQGRGVFLLRPLLALTREEVRRAMGDAGRAWIDDPANEDRAHPRIRVRSVAACPASGPPSDDGATADLASQVRFDGGLLRLSRRAFLAAAQASRRRVLAAALVCAGGGERVLARAMALRAESAAMDGGAYAGRGARLASRGTDVVVWRNAGEYARAGEPRLDLHAGETGVFDGRFEISALEDCRLVPVRGRMGALPPGDQEALKRWDATVRPTLPAAMISSRPGPILAEAAASAVRWLVPERFFAACGLLAREADVAAGASGETDGMGLSRMKSGTKDRS